jgi:hypothetical protein
MNCFAKDKLVPSCIAGEAAPAAFQKALNDGVTAFIVDKNVDLPRAVEPRVRSLQFHDSFTAKWDRHAEQIASAMSPIRRHLLLHAIERNAIPSRTTLFPPKTHGWNYLATRRKTTKDFAGGALNERQGAASSYQRGSRNPRPRDALAFWRRYSA